MMTPREQHADLIVLEMFDALRSSRRHDYGCGQRVAELNRRRRELERCDHDRRGAAITRAELADAFARVGRPRLARLERDGFGTASSRAGMSAWRTIERLYGERVEVTS